MRPAKIGLLSAFVGFFLFVVDLACLFQAWLMLFFARGATGWAAVGLTFTAFFFAWFAALSFSLGGLISVDAAYHALLTRRGKAEAEKDRGKP